MADYEAGPLETPFRLDVLFTSLAVQQLFMNYYISSKKYVTIRSVDKNGHFHGEIASDFTVKLTEEADGCAQSPSSLETDPTMEHQCTWKRLSSPVTIPPSITEENGNDLASEITQDEKLLLVQEEHANASSGAKSTTVTGSSSHHSSYLQHPKPTKSPQLSYVSTASDKGPSAASHDKGTDDKGLMEKREHTIFCLLHGTEVSLCPFYSTPEECRENFDHMFGIGFEQFMKENQVVVTSPSAAIKDHPGNGNYMLYIKNHLKSKNCPSFCARLWKFCTDNNLCHLYKYADEGLLIYSKTRPDRVGTLCNDYANVMVMEVIGRGGFGKVYLHTSPSGLRFAIKREKKHPLVDGDAKLFMRILQLKHLHVIEMFEYIVGPCDEHNKQSYLFVMPFMNRKGLDEQFKAECKCVLAFMDKYPNQRKLIFCNFLELFHQVFDGLSYLKTQQIVHRDIKSSNILVHQNCKCSSPLMCTCPEGNKTLYVLGDMDLLCNEGECSLIKSEVWDKMAMHEPAGTIEMRPPESFYRTGEGDPVISHKSDVWSGCVTMMNVLVGRGANTEPHTQISAFLKTATKIVKSAFQEIDSCCNALENIIKKFGSLKSGKSFNPVITTEMNSLSADFKRLRKTLNDSNTSLKKVQSFQGCIPETYREENPLDGILSTVYVANSLHWTCLKSLPHIYNTPLWECICNTLDIIAEGVRFNPENRKDAGEIVELLKPIETAVMS